MSRIWAVIDEGTGTVVQTMHMNHNDLHEGAPWGEGYFVRDISAAPDANDFVRTRYFGTDDAFHMLPDRPEGEYEFDRNTETWVFQPERFGQLLRVERDARLGMTDWTQMPDNPLSTEKKAEWATYRQELRDLPANVPGDVHSIYAVVWPDEPV